MPVNVIEITLKVVELQSRCEVFTDKRKSEETDLYPQLPA
jgi:hypothetical protein